MKKLKLFLFFNLLVSQSLFSQINKTIDDLINADSFQFHAEKVIASGRKQDMKVTNSVSTLSRSVNLVGEFGISMDNKNLIVNLPDYQNQIDQSQGAIYTFSFTSKDYKITKKRSKRGEWIIKINPSDISSSRNGIVQEIVINILQNGKSVTNIYINKNSANNVQTFEGYITKNEV